MLQLHIPGTGDLTLRHLLLDYNGTLARDGTLVPGVADRLRQLGEQMAVHVVTADTFGKARAQLAGMPLTLHILAEEYQAEAKMQYICRLGPAESVAVGNGRNDRLMVAAAALGIAVVQDEGAAAGCLAAADVVCRTILDALDLLLNPLRLRATLRQ
ncbi:MAG: ATPase P [Acidobacteria bacterium]|nr:ATPase P [Acidobacteriota bacterium]